MIESEKGVNGSKAVEIIVNTLEPNPWNVEVSYDDIPAEWSKAQWIAIVQGHITQVATHFEEEGDNDTLVSWDIVNEAFMENGR